jgi:pyruvate carboxylase subunit B
MRPSGRAWSLLLFPADRPAQGPPVAKSFDVRIEWPEADLAVVRVGGRPVDVTLARVTAPRRGGPSAESQTWDGALRAPMSGRVVRVLVVAGEAVEVRQGLVVVEAMKMENELRAPHAGVVRVVRVAAGDSVDATEVLVELDT